MNEWYEVHESNNAVRLSELSIDDSDYSLWRFPLKLDYMAHLLNATIYKSLTRTVQKPLAPEL